MGKIGVITDAHGNLAATEAILNYLDGLGCDEIIHTGDVVDIGPCSRECLELLLSRYNVTLLLGNHDRDFALNEYEARKLSHVPTEHKKQVFGTLNDELREKVSKFPLYTTRKCGKDTLLFCHYAFKQQPFDITKYPFGLLSIRRRRKTLTDCLTGRIVRRCFSDTSTSPATLSASVCTWTSAA